MEIVEISWLGFAEGCVIPGFGCGRCGHGLGVGGGGGLPLPALLLLLPLALPLLLAFAFPLAFPLSFSAEEALLFNRLLAKQHLKYYVPK